MSKNENSVTVDVTEEIGVFRLRAVAFLCGASLMALEMAGVRLVEPYFGSTHYVWGSIIGIFLGALSLGYYLGGILSDRSPRMATLGMVIIISALFCLLVPLLAGPLCGALRDQQAMDPRLRAVLGSLVLYAVPSILMGMASPFAVRLAARSVKGMGHVAGGLYALSTLGSIAGTFLVSFILTEWIGSKTTVWGVGGVLLLTGGVCLIGRVRVAPAALLVLGLAFAAGTFTRARALDVPTLFPKGQTCKESLESAYHTIHLLEADSYLVRGRKARYMVFNNLIESGVLLEDDGTVTPGRVKTGCLYTRMLHLGVLFTQTAPRRMLVIGCGGGVGPQEFYQDYTESMKRIDVVDIDPAVFEMAHKYFQFPLGDEHPVIRSYAQDGRLFVHHAAPDTKWDYVVLDAYSAGGRIPRHLITQEFFQQVDRHLDPQGVVVANIISAMDGKHSRLYRAVTRTMQSVFGEDAVYVFPRSGRGEKAQNVLIVAAPGETSKLSRQDIRARYRLLSKTLLQQPGLENTVSWVQTTLPDPQTAVLLTDDYCPTDSMVSH